MITLETLIYAAEQAACGSSHETKKAAAEVYQQTKVAFAKSEQAWVKVHQLQYALYDFQLAMEETP